MKAEKPSNPFWSKKRAAIAASFACFVATAVLGAFDSADRASYDAFAKMALPVTPEPSGIVLVAVDRRTVERYGEQSFWTRTRYQQVLENIEAAGAKAAYFDYYFSDPAKPENVDWDLLAKTEGWSEDRMNEAYRSYSMELKKSDFVSEVDYAFAREMKRYGNVYLPSLLRTSDGGNDLEGVAFTPFWVFREYARVGFVNVAVDPDGVRRRAYPEIGAHQSISVLLASAMSWTGVAPKTSSDGSYYFRYSGKPRSGTFPIVPFEYAHNGVMTTREGEPVSLTGKLVIVGDYDERGGDAHEVPTDEKVSMAGMEIIAHQVKSLLDGTDVREVPEWFALTASSALALAFATLFATSFPSILSVVLAVVAAVASVGFSYSALRYSPYWIPPSDFVAASAFPLVGWGVGTYLQTSEDRNRVRKIFSRYVTPSVVETLVRQEWTNLAGEKRNVSVLFADIEGFTTLSESLDPEATVSRLNRIFSVANESIFSTDGTINKYIGDAVMAFWWAPVDVGNHASAACRSALEMIAKSKKADSELRLRIGIATGEAVVGNVGDDRFSDYTVMGDRVNFASRLEGTTRKYGVDILVSEETVKSVGYGFVFRELDSIRVKGKRNAEAVYELVGYFDEQKPKDKAFRFRYATALASYRSGDFAAARREFESLARDGDGPSKALAARIDAWKGKPPAGFDGSYSFDTK